MTDRSLTATLAPGEPPRVSVIIPTRNRPTDVGELLPLVARQTLPPAEVIVVDDSPGGETAQAVESFRATHPRFPVILIREQTGSLPRARNLGVDRATGEYVAFIDDDARVRDDYLATLAETLRRLGPAYAGGGAMWTGNPDFTPLTIPAQGFKQFFLLGHYGNGRFLPNGMIRTPREQRRLVDTEIVSGGYGLFRRSVLLEYRYDELMSGYSIFEDVDLSYRVSRRYRLFYAPAAVVYHRGAHDEAGDRRAFGRMFMRNYLYHFHKNVPKTAVAWFALGWSVAGLYCRALANGVAGLAAGYTRGLSEWLSGARTPA